MGKASRDKGNRCERGFVHLMAEQGIGAERVPLSGACGGSHSGDVKLWTVWREWLFEGKSRRNGFKQIYEWLSPPEIDALFLKADRQPYLVVMTAEKFAELIREAEGA